MFGGQRYVRLSRELPASIVRIALRLGMIYICVVSHCKLPPRFASAKAVIVLFAIALSEIQLIEITDLFDQPCADHQAKPVQKRKTRVEPCTRITHQSRHLCN